MRSHFAVILVPLLSERKKAYTQCILKLYGLLYKHDTRGHVHIPCTHICMYCIHTYLHIEEEEKNKVVRIEGVKEGRKEGRKH